MAVTDDEISQLARIKAHVDAEDTEERSLALQRGGVTEVLKRTEVLCRDYLPPHLNYESHFMGEDGIMILTSRPSPFSGEMRGMILYPLSEFQAAYEYQEKFWLLDDQ